MRCVTYRYCHDSRSMFSGLRLMGKHSLFAAAVASCSAQTSAIFNILNRQPFRWNHLSSHRYHWLFFLIGNAGEHVHTVEK